MTSDTVSEAGAAHRPPVGIILLSLLFVLYGLVWFVAGMFGTEAFATLSMIVCGSTLLLACFLYTGHAIAWWSALVFLGGSTIWRLSLVASGEPENISNAVGGILLFVYLVSQYEFYRADPAER